MQEVRIIKHAFYMHPQHAGCVAYSIEQKGLSDPSPSSPRLGKPRAPVLASNNAWPVADPTTELHREASTADSASISRTAFPLSYRSACRQIIGSTFHLSEGGLGLLKACCGPRVASDFASDPIESDLPRPRSSHSHRTSCTWSPHPLSTSTCCQRSGMQSVGQSPCLSPTSIRRRA